MPLGRIFSPSLQLNMMNIITWNIRGLNGISKERILRNCVKSENLDILLTLEVSMEYPNKGFFEIVLNQKTMIYYYFRKPKV